MNAILDFLSRNATHRPRIAVYGDVVLDFYYQSTAHRISSEFPIPVLNATNTPPVIRPGGAANVCEQLSFFNTDVVLFSILDNTAKDCFQTRKFDCSYSVFPDHTRVPIKKR